MPASSQSANPPLPAVSYQRHPGAAGQRPAGYRRREPEKTALHTVVREHLETFLEEARLRDGEGYPRFVERQFRRYLDCGLLCRGFVRLRCPSCGFERLVGFSCKGRICPSCVARRMSDTAAYLVDQLLPEARYRQWVLTFPWVLRFRLAVDRPLFSALIGAFLRTVFAWQRCRGRALGIVGGQVGAVTFIHRFGGALNLHPHLHSVLPDGLFVPDQDDAESELTFVPLPAPSTEEIEQLTLKVARRLTAVVERHCDDACETEGLLEQTVGAMQDALTAALKPPLSAPDLRLPGTESQAPAKPFCGKVAGFSLHAGQAVEADDRPALERLCRYGLRAPFSQERLVLGEDGRVIYFLRRPWPDSGGVDSLVLEPRELLRRLAALVPAPYTHMVRYHGVFSGRSKFRRRLPAPPPPIGAGGAPPGQNTSQGDDGASGVLPGDEISPDEASLPATAASGQRRRRVPWAELLMRVLFVDALSCARCSTPMVVLAFLSDPTVTAKILRHLDLPATAPPLAPAEPVGGDEAGYGPLFPDGARSPP